MTFSSSESPETQLQPITMPERSINTSSLKMGAPYSKEDSYCTKAIPCLNQVLNILPKTSLSPSVTYTLTRASILSSHMTSKTSTTTPNHLESLGKHPRTSTFPTTPLSLVFFETYQRKQCPYPLQRRKNTSAPSLTGINIKPPHLTTYRNCMANYCTLV